MRDPAGRTLLLSHPPYAAEVVTVGATLRSLTRDGLDLVAGFSAGERCTAYRGWVLMPWPNRVADGRYRHAGAELQLPITEVGANNALHGLVGWMPWAVDAHDGRRARLTLELPPRDGYDGCLDLAVTYELGDDGLTVTLEATNSGATAAPYGAGHHPYLTVGRRTDECELALPGSAFAPMDERGHPSAVRTVDGTDLDFRGGRLLGSTVIDHPFAELDRNQGWATVTLRDPDSGRGVRLQADPAFRWLHVFTADDQGDRARESLAVEPMTCPPDAFNSGTDLVVLEPGDAHRASYRLSGLGAS
ncbi:MAG TPA: aldose 1-epimerase family protein [Nocardioides sp.]|nr:aldose 1-epimerase family protein [Nocardioides sp.]